VTGPRPETVWAGPAGELVEDRAAAPGRDDERERDLVRVYLQPGQLYASAQPSAVTTVLGSCVAICLWDPLTSVGGMNHYLLPFFAGAGHGSPRFGNAAMAQLLDRLQALGAARGRLQAKVFGGACVLEAFQAREGHLGEKNAGVAFKLLGDLGIPVVSRDVGGRSGRKLIFHTDLGSAWVAKL
jgi:chemotaxis protein CheD